MSSSFPFGIPSSVSFQDLADELGCWFHLNGCYETAYQFWIYAFWCRSTPSTIHDAEWCHSLQLIGLKLHIRNRPREAEKYLGEALEYKELTLSHDYKKVCDTLVRIARVLVAQHKHEKAEAYFRRALDGYTRLLSDGDVKVLQISDEFAYSLACQATYGAVREADKLARTTLKAREKLLGRMHQETVESVWTLGFAVEKAGRRDDARRLYQRAYEDGKSLLTEQHVDVVDYKRDLERLGREDDETVQWFLL